MGMSPPEIRFQHSNFTLLPQNDTCIMSLLEYPVDSLIQCAMTYM